MGGNIFDLAKPIKKEHIKPTLFEFFKELTQIFPKAGSYFKSMKTLGSVGKKDYSGDIDLALSGDVFKNIQDWGLDEKYVQELFEKFKKRSRNATDDQLMKRVVIVSIAEKIQESQKDIEVDVKGSSSGALFLAFPQYDENKERLDSYVQIDINVGNVDWLSFAYYSDKYEGNVKGLHRTQLMLSLFSTKGYTFSHNYGVKNKETQEIEVSTTQEAIELLNRLYNFNIDSSTLSNYFKLQEFLQKNLSPEDRNEVYDTYIMILDRTRADIPEDLQAYWIDNQERLKLTGKFLPDNSKLKKYATQ
jgi:hypothetical protein